MSPVERYAPRAGRSAVALLAVVVLVAGLIVLAVWALWWAT